jgi:hypothetical protein
MPTVSITAPTDERLSHTYAGQSGRGRAAGDGVGWAFGMTAAASARFTAAVL